MAEFRHLEQLATEVQRNAGITAAAVPERVVMRELAPLRHLIGPRLDLLQAHHVRLIALQPVAQLRLPRADSVDVPGSDFHGQTSRRGGASFTSCLSCYRRA